MKQLLSLSCVSSVGTSAGMKAGITSMRMTPSLMPSLTPSPLCRVVVPRLLENFDLSARDEYDLMRWDWHDRQDMPVMTARAAKANTPVTTPAALTATFKDGLCATNSISGSGVALGAEEGGGEGDWVGTGKRAGLDCGARRTPG